VYLLNDIVNLSKAGFIVMRIFVATLFSIVTSFYSITAHSTEPLIWPKGKVAVSLSYDDSLETHLENVVPVLNEHQFKASFYIVPASDVFQERLFEWRAIAKQGHELGNHSLKHSCRGSLEGREWVQLDLDLDKQSASQVVLEVRIANSLLKALDGKQQRTYTIPCGDEIAGGENYIELLAGEFVSIKGMESPRGFSATHVPANATVDELIQLITNNPASTKLVNIIFHGVGGDYLTVSNQAHEGLLTYLAANQDKYWVETYLNIMTASGRP
jgi:hypothetical protein